MKITLRPYQLECVDAINKLPLGERGLVVLPTASGKTQIFSNVVANNEGRSLIIVPSDELKCQARDKLLNLDPTLDIGLIQANVNEVSNKICIATRQSLSHKKSTRIERMLEHGNFTKIIIDEVHNATGQIDKILSQMDCSKAKVIAFTATPWSKDLSSVFSNRIYTRDILTMIEEKYLCEPKVIQVSTKTSLAGVKTVAGEFNQRQLELCVDNSERNDLIVKAYKKIAIDRKYTVVYCAGIEHSVNLAAEFQRNGISCGSIDSTLSREERTNIINKFETGVIKVLCNVAILTTGYDFPPLDAIILARPTKSKILFCQILGRMLRLSEGKEDGLLIDFKDASSSHDIMDMDNMFDVNFKNGQKLSEALEDKKNEAEAVRVEREKVELERIENLEIIAKQIKLFNKEMKLAFAEVSYDWFRCTPSIYAVSESSDHHLAIESGDGEFLIYKVVTEKGNKSVEFVDAFENIIDAIKATEESIKNPKSFAYKDAGWKFDNATENQKKYVPWAKNKFDCHKYFTANSIKSQLRNF
ncbi:DEAD/DEAH box helicase [Clostridium sp. FP2]|uniref:DEAD/DEAH box helicase n=1 Tax=Clostridium sp. FP2 TaxID=2724481 RepID=UPI0013E92054|nr:DEAD/DEAH box helicase [Clostridium sp. FP2]MBZ9622868.1 DEAD/DEAH box helicase [Clostridium sp. FP2]